MNECKPLVVGTAFALPEEVEPSSGRILVLKAGAYTRPLFKLNLSRF